MTVTLLLSPALAEGPGISGLGWGVDVPLVSLLNRPVRGILKTSMFDSCVLHMFI
jgi:hypothetical protein